MIALRTFYRSPRMQLLSEWAENARLLSDDVHSIHYVMDETRWHRDMSFGIGLRTMQNGPVIRGQGS